MNFWKAGLIALLVPMLLPGCKTLTASEPEWVANPKAVYPESTYLATVGEGDTRRAAENAAAANLSRIFEARIEADERLLDQSRESGTEFERTTDYTSDIKILSAQTLYNVQHAEAWKGDNGRYHAVAYLDRAETARIYLDRIAGQTARVEFLLGDAEKTGGLLKQYAILRAADRNAAENELLLRQLKVIQPRRVAEATPDYSRNAIRKALADTAKQIRVQIKIDGDNERRLASCLEEWITRYGFVAAKPAVLDVDGRIAITDTGERVGDLVFVRYEMQLQVKDAQGSVVVAINKKGREAHKTLPQARTRSIRTLENAIKADGAQRLDAYFDSLVDQQPK